MEGSVEPIPLVSVIIPAYNCAAFVGEAVRSVMRQDYPRKEIIAVNDGSTDETLSVLQSFGNDILVLDQPNAGAAAARNAGLRHAKGGYIAFLDGDDLWFAGKLGLQVRYLEEHPDVGLVFTDWTIWPEARDPRPLHMRPRLSKSLTDVIDPNESGWIYSRLLLDCVLNTSTVLIRSTIIREVGDFEQSLRNGQDYDFWLRISRITEIHKLVAPLAVYRHHGGNSTHHPKPTNYPYLVVTRALERWGPDGPDGRRPDSAALRRRLAALCFDFAYKHYWKGDALLARQSLIRCLRHRPFWFRAWLYLTVSFISRRVFTRRHVGH
jgi:glycosyltransferase involved in cell wall biosynthesis